MSNLVFHWTTNQARLSWGKKRTADGEYKNPFPGFDVRLHLIRMNTPSARQDGRG